MKKISIIPFAVAGLLGASLPAMAQGLPDAGGGGGARAAGGAGCHCHWYLDPALKTRGPHFVFRCWDAATDGIPGGIQGWGPFYRLGMQGSDAACLSEAEIESVRSFPQCTGRITQCTAK